MDSVVSYLNHEAYNDVLDVWVLRKGTTEQIWNAILNWGE